MSFAAAHYRSENCYLAPFEILGYERLYLLVGVAHHRFARYRRVGPRGAGEQQTQEVVYLGNGSHRGAGILVGGFLLYCHHWAEPRDFIDVGPLHSADELPCIGGQRLHVAALPFGVQGVESQRRLARAGESGYDYEFVARNLQIHVFQIVGPRAVYLYLVLLQSVPDDLSKNETCKDSSLFLKNTVSVFRFAFCAASDRTLFLSAGDADSDINEYFCA